FAELAWKQVDPAPLGYLWAVDHPNVDQERLLLSDEELVDLSDAFRCCPPRLDRRWEPYESLHRRHLHTVPEVRAALSGPAAEEWSRACARFGERLSAGRVSLPDGIELIGEWVGRSGGSYWGRWGRPSCSPIPRAAPRPRPTRTRRPSQPPRPKPSSGCD